MSTVLKRSLLVIVSLFALIMALAPAADARAVIFNNGSDLSYKGCRVWAQASDLGMGNKSGYANVVVVKARNDAIPAGCTWELTVHTQWWDSAAKRSRTGDDTWLNLQNYGSRPVLDYISHGTGSDRVTSAVVTLCRDYWDDCKSYSGSLVA